MTLESLRDKLQQRQEILQQSFMQVGRGRTQCEINKTGETGAELKALEARLKAVSEMLRCWRAEKELAVCLTEIQASWQAMSEISEAWRVYKKAGLDEIEQLLSDLSA